MISNRKIKNMKILTAELLKLTIWTGNINSLIVRIVRTWGLTVKRIGIKPSCFGIKYAHVYHPLPHHLKTPNENISLPRCQKSLLQTFIESTLLIPKVKKSKLEKIIFETLLKDLTCTSQLPVDSQRSSLRENPIWWEDCLVSDPGMWKGWTKIFTTSLMANKKISQ